MNPERLAIIVGGPSPEAVVSRASGASVADAIKGTYAEVAVIEFDQQLSANLQTFRPDVVLPALHGSPGEDGTMQGYLEVLGYPYIGSDVAASAKAMDKAIAKQIFSSVKLQVVAGLNLHKAQISQKTDWSALQADIQESLGEQIVIKPASQGSALGTARIHIQDLQEALSEAFTYSEVVLAEKRIYGREITVGVLEKGANNALALPVTEVTTPEASWYDYQHRYEKDASKHLIPADLPKPVASALQQAALDAHNALQCRDLSRADFIVTPEDEIYLLEVNTMPGMTGTSLYPDAARVAGYSLNDLMQILIDNAWHRR